MDTLTVQNQPTSSLIQRYSSSPLPTEWGNFTVHTYRDAYNHEHLAICKGNFQLGVPTLVRIHSACFTGEALGSLKCDCKAQLNFALQKIQEIGRGAVIYLFQEGRGIGLGNKIKAYALQELQGLDTVDANTHLGFSEDARSYEDASAILQDLQIDTLQLMTNNPHKVKSLQNTGIVVADRIQIEVGLNAVNYDYLHTKQNRMGHWLNVHQPPPSSALEHDTLKSS
jgi:GTP cyclohydrolase II